MGVSVHKELRDFLLLLSYPNGLSCKECIQTAYSRGYEETKQTSFNIYNENNKPKKEVRLRIKSHMESNYKMLKLETKGTDVENLEELSKKSDKGKVIFNDKDKKAYFVPGKNKDTMKAWLTYSLHLPFVYDDLLRRINDYGNSYPTYNSIIRKKPRGWENHDEMVLLFYVQKFPGKSAYDILEEAEWKISGTRWPPKFVKSLKELRILNL